MSVKKISHDNQLVLMGSWLQRFNERLLFQVLFFSFNPFGTIYNPISLSQNIKSYDRKYVF